MNLLSPAESLAQLKETNRRVNASVTYTADQTNYGRLEYWAEAVDKGDCEDYALAKRRMLLAAGWPNEKLDIAECHTEDGSLHAVLVAHVYDSDYVLDNRYEDVPLWRDLPYKWTRVSVNGDFRNWREVV